MNFLKKLTGKDASKSSGCCDVEIKEVATSQEESCCETSDSSTTCCETTNAEPSSCC